MAKLRCNPGNYQCGGICQPNSRKCVITAKDTENFDRFAQLVKDRIAREVGPGLRVGQGGVTKPKIRKWQAENPEAKDLLAIVDRHIKYWQNDKGIDPPTFEEQQQAKAIVEKGPVGRELPERNSSVYKDTDNIEIEGVSSSKGGARAVVNGTIVLSLLENTKATVEMVVSEANVPARIAEKLKKPKEYSFMVDRSFNAVSNESLERNYDNTIVPEEKRSIADTRARIQNVLKDQFAETMAKLPDFSIVTSSAWNSDGKGKARERAYKRMGFGTYGVETMQVFNSDNGKFEDLNSAKMAAIKVGNRLVPIDRAEELLQDPTLFGESVLPTTEGAFDSAFFDLLLLGHGKPEVDKSDE